MVFYRIVRSSPPTERDFFSRARLGKRQYRNETDDQYRFGISVYDDLAYTIDRAFEFGLKLGNYVVAVEFEDGAYRCERDTSDLHHYEVFDYDQTLFSCVAGDCVPCIAG